MKQLVLIRHSKTEPDSPTGKDFDRPLIENRKGDARLIATQLLQRNVQPDFVLSSAALRAKETAKLFCERMQFDVKKVVLKQELYACSVEIILEVIQETPDKFQTIFLFGHNPELTLFVNRFEGVFIDELPTTGTICLEWNKPDWKLSFDDKSAFQFFLHP